MADVSPTTIGQTPSVVHTLQRVMVVGRWLCWTWMVGVVAFAGHALIHPVVAWTAVVAMLAIAVTATNLARSDPERLRRAAFVVTETVLVLLVAVAVGYVFRPGHVFTTSQDLAVEFPLIVAVTSGIAAGPYVAAAIGFLFGPARLVSAALNDFSHFGRRHLVASLATAFFYSACGALNGWLVLLLRRSEAEISHHRARDEMSRVLHDTVLQTLALVDRRHAASIRNSPPRRARPIATCVHFCSLTVRSAPTRPERTRSRPESIARSAECGQSPTSRSSST